MKPNRAKIHAMFVGRCAYCGEEITLKNMNIDHVQPIIRECKYDHNKHRFISNGKILIPEFDCEENMLPACRPCNNWKHSMSLEDFRESISKQPELIRKLNAGFRLIERYGLIHEIKKPIIFYFEMMGHKLTPILRNRQRNFTEDSQYQEVKT